MRSNTIMERFGYWESRFGVARRERVREERSLAAGIRSMIDHTCLRAGTTEKDVLRLCHEAAEMGFGAVCVAPVWVDLCASDRASYKRVFRIASVIDFPLGAGSTVSRMAAVREVISAGADEADIVMPLGKFLSGRYEYVFEDLRVLSSAGIYTKVILETSLLGKTAAVDAAIISLLAGADCLKTSTGVNGQASVEDVGLLRDVAGNTAGVKASGGIRTMADIKAMRDAGADRIGMSSAYSLFAGEEKG